ncbi:MAG: hypothetical protein LM570_03675 [Thermocrinis sp.]|nr:hypothetical protein [Thermocrinis sp.]
MLSHTVGLELPDEFVEKLKIVVTIPHGGLRTNTQLQIATLKQCHHPTQWAWNEVAQISRLSKRTSLSHTVGLKQKLGSGAWRLLLYAISPSHAVGLEPCTLRLNTDKWMKNLHPTQWA